MLLNSSNYLNIPPKLKTAKGRPFIRAWTTDGSGDETKVRSLAHQAAAIGAEYLILDIENSNDIQSAAYPNNPAQALVRTMFQAVEWVRSENVKGIKLGVYGVGTTVLNSLAVYEQCDLDILVPSIYYSEWQGAAGWNCTWKNLISIEIAACEAVEKFTPVVPMMCPRVTYDSPSLGKNGTMLPNDLILMQMKYLWSKCNSFAVWDTSTPPEDAAKGLFTQTDWNTQNWFNLLGSVA